MQSTPCRRFASSIVTCALHRPRYGPHTTPPPQHDGEDIPVINPANGEQLCIVTSASSADIQSTIQSAHHTFQSGQWSKAPAVHRSKVLTRIARALEQRVPDFARIETLQTGRTLREMNAQLGRLPEWLDYYAALLRTREAAVMPTQGKLLNYVQRVPLGVVAHITPFNHPLLIALKKIAPALAAGNSVVVKPSELAPISLLEFAQLAEEVGLPKGVLQVLPGYGTTVGKELVSHPLIRKVDITAGTSTGRALGSIVGGNLAAFTAELGGKAPLVIFNDTDMQSAVNGAAFAAFVASGQTCVSGARLVVQAGVYDEFVAQFVEKARGITRRMGDPLNPASSMGTVISARHLARIEAVVQRHRERGHSRVVIGGERLTGKSELDGFDFDKGAFFAPTVIEDVDVADEVWQEEIFGPVVVVKKFETEAEGVALANDSKYGLGAGVWTQDLSRAHRVAADIEAGLVWVNTHHRNDPSSPWGGMKESGIGRENGLEALDAYTQTKSTIVNIATAEESRRTDDWFSDAGAARYG